MMQHLIQTMSLTFNYRAQKADIPAFRKKVWHFVGWGATIFHNHDIEEGNFVGKIHRYPQIQYRTHEGNANMWGVNEGATALMQLAEQGKFLPAISLPLIHAFPLLYYPPETQERSLYKLFGYVPFNKENYKAYQQAETYEERLAMLTRVLTNHLVGFAHGVGWNIDQSMPLVVTLHDITNIGRAVYQPADKSVKNVFTAFDLSFYVNAELPDQAGIGMLTSLGYGLLKRWEMIN
ncbi:MAG: CRISPR-associated endonuclease Cas6 [Bacteroidia bacterium]